LVDGALGARANGIARGNAEDGDLPCYAASDGPLCRSELWFYLMAYIRRIGVHSRDVWLHTAKAFSQALMKLYMRYFAFCKSCN
jgi:hypothetical protein